MTNELKTNSLPHAFTTDTTKSNFRTTKNNKRRIKQRTAEKDKRILKMKCKNCRYYTGIQCHGHGEFWGSCMLLEMARKEIQSQITKNQYTTDNWLGARYDEDECLFITKGLEEIKEFEK